MAVIEYARNVLDIPDANSLEFDPHLETRHVITHIPGQTGNLGGTMKLGKQKTIIQQDTLAERVYDKTEIFERHRHRYSVSE